MTRENKQPLLPCSIGFPGRRQSRLGGTWQRLAVPKGVDVGDSTRGLVFPRQLSVWGRGYLLHDLTPTRTSVSPDSQSRRLPPPSDHRGRNSLPLDTCAGKSAPQTPRAVLLDTRAQVGGLSLPDPVGPILVSELLAELQQDTHGPGI